jgi:ketosteroid isomerase-like protein
VTNVDIIKRLYKAFEEGDIDAVFEVLDPNIEWIEADGIPYAGRFVGYDAIRDGVFAKIGAEWDNFTAEVHEFIDGGDVVVTLGTDGGIYKGTGKKMRAPTASVWRLKDGKVIYFRQYIDSLAVVTATR